MLQICSKNSPLSKTTNEEYFRICFENELNRLLRELGFIGNTYEIFSHENKNESGRTDFQYSSSIIEYKKFGKLRSKKDLISTQI